MAPPTDENRLYTYLRFDPNAITGALLKQLEADTTLQLMAFPFANGELYSDEFALDETKTEQLQDGMLYAVAPKKNPIVRTLKSNTALRTVELDELYLPNETDTTLQFQAFREAGYTEAMIARIRLCLLKRPSGFVRYLDGETGTMRNVASMQVIGLVFGIPIHTYTNSNGYYTFPWRFNAGTIMATKAKNNRVNIKPLNTQGAWWLTIPLQFVVGSVSVRGWVSSCNMNREVNFEYRDHRQNRYWAQLMHSVNLHDQYATADDIQKAPRNLSFYAHWDDNYGIASAPMLGHFNPVSAIQENVINGIFGGSINMPTDYPNIFNLLTGALPDVTIKTGNVERDRYSARLMQTAFHELGHGSHFQIAGHLYWGNFIMATLFPNGNCGGYGCGTGNTDGHVEVGESWAEFIGTAHALRNHPNGRKNSVQLGIERFDVALEDEQWFFNNWIPTGIYNDLIDVTNTNTAENVWDQVGGLSIQEVYIPLGPNVTSMCGYAFEIANRYPALAAGNLDLIFQNNRPNGGCL